MNMDQHAAAVRAAHPYPSADPLDRLRHTVSIFRSSDADAIAVLATGGNIYPNKDCISGGQTGLTHGDLRVLLDRLGG
jgi:hypothetical protein